MATAKSTKKTPKFLDKFYQKFSWYGFSLLKATFGVCLLFMLFTYDSIDGGFFSSGYSDHETYNAIGIVGAYIADLLIRLLGIAAFIWPITIIFSSLLRLIVKNLQQPSFIMRKVAHMAVLLSLSVLAAMHSAPESFAYPHGSGGLLGSSLGWRMMEVFGLLGANIILMLVLFLAPSYQFNIPWGRVFEITGRWVDEKWARLLHKDDLASMLHKPVHEIFNKRHARQSKAGIWSWLSSPWHHFFAVKQANSFEKTPQGRTVDLFPPASIDETDITLALGRENQKAVDPTVAYANEEHANEAFEATNTNKTMPLESKRDVRIVPLEQTHKQDTGESTVTTERKIKKVEGCPPVSLLDAPAVSMNPGLSKEEIEQMSELLEAKLLDFNVIAEVVEVNPGPVITRFEIQPAPGTKVSKISNLAKDLARSMAVLSVRVVEVIAGKSVIGIEIPNQHREMVCISEVLGSKTYQASSSPLTMGLGNDIAGKPVVVDLTKMPHLLVAGTTGSGKSVGVNAMIISLLLKSTPEQVRLLLVDPKMLELSVYDGIPHLLAPVITDMKEAAGGLHWCVAEMERRYKVMASQGVRNIAGYNTKVAEANASGTPIVDPVWQPNELAGETQEDRPSLQEFSYIVVVVDEFADMMMIVGKKVEELIARIAQKARAAGIHLILATQRPSVDVITGLIKANVPTRIAFQVSSKIDSRTILDQGGAESLLGHGDMLYLPAGKSVPERVHGAFVSDDEVHRIVEDWKKRGTPEFVSAIVEGAYDQEGGSSAGSGTAGYEEEQDSLYDEAVAFVTESRRASISSVQRRFKIGYNRAARMIEYMEAEGVISSQAHNGSREVIAPPPVRD